MVDTPLKCEVEGDELVIRIGLNTLVHAAENCPLFYNGTPGTFPPYEKVIDAGELADDVRRELLREEEDGTTPLHILFDNAIEKARDDGSLAFSEDVF